MIHFSKSGINKYNYFTMYRNNIGIYLLLLRRILQCLELDLYKLNSQYTAWSDREKLHAQPVKLVYVVKGRQKELKTPVSYSTTIAIDQSLRVLCVVRISTQRLTLTHTHTEHTLTLPQPQHTHTLFKLYDFLPPKI